MLIRCEKHGEQEAVTINAKKYTVMCPMCMSNATKPKSLSDVSDDVAWLLSNPSHNLVITDWRNIESFMGIIFVNSAKLGVNGTPIGVIDRISIYPPSVEKAKADILRNRSA